MRGWARYQFHQKYGESHMVSVIWKIIWRGINQPKIEKLNLTFFQFTIASEFRSWILVRASSSQRNFAYRLPWPLLSFLKLLLHWQTSPSVHEVSKAERLLQQFCFKYATYCGRWSWAGLCIKICASFVLLHTGERYYTANVYHLLHLDDCPVPRASLGAFNLLIWGHQWLAWWSI